MSQRIWKFVVPFTGGPESWATVPKGAAILRAGEQARGLVVWARVDPEAPTVQRWFHLVMTGAEIPSSAGPYVDTVQMKDGLVVHLFDLGERPSIT